MRYREVREAIIGHNVVAFGYDLEGVYFLLDNDAMIKPIAIEVESFGEEIAEKMEKYGRTVTRVHLQPTWDCGQSVVMKIVVGGEQDAFSLYSRIDGVYYGG